MRPATWSPILFFVLATFACSDDDLGPTGGGRTDAGADVDLSGVTGVTVWGASEQARIFVGDIDPEAQGGIARDPADPLDDGITEIELPQPIAQSTLESHQRSVVAVDGAAWVIPRDRASLLRVPRAGSSTTAVTVTGEARAIDGDDDGLYAIVTDLGAAENTLLAIDSDTGAELGRLDLGYDNNQGGPIHLIAADDEYVVASHQNGPSPVHVISRAGSTEVQTLGPFDGLIRSVAVDGGRVYVVTSGDRVTDPHRVDVFEAASGAVVDEGLELPAQRVIIADGFVAVGSGFTNSDGSTFIGTVADLETVTALDRDSGVTAVAEAGGWGVLLVRGATLVFDPVTLEVVFENELFGRVGDIYVRR